MCQGNQCVSYIIPDQRPLCIAPVYEGDCRTNESPKVRTSMLYGLSMPVRLVVHCETGK